MADCLPWTADELAALPEKPEGWTRRMTLHMNFGPDGGVGVYDVFDPEGRKASFGYQYDTRKGGGTGFIAADTDGCLSWVQLRQHYAAARTAMGGTDNG